MIDIREDNYGGIALGEDLKFFLFLSRRIKFQHPVKLKSHNLNLSVQIELT
jgi:hypothetical protein